jgi:hypothetical protein
MQILESRVDSGGSKPHTDTLVYLLPLVHFFSLEMGQSQPLHQSMHTSLFITLLSSFTTYYNLWITKGLHMDQPNKYS